jgi:hypothetical protein
VQPTTDIDTLLPSLNPQLRDGVFVFCTVPADAEDECWDLKPLATFRESEGLSVIVNRTVADEHGYRYSSLHRCITLRVHSSLDAVGLTAAISKALADAGLSANVVAAHHHDHVLVPAHRAETAMKCLETLSQSASQ